jgi:hypothetical protein
MPPTKRRTIPTVKSSKSRAPEWRYPQVPSATLHEWLDAILRSKRPEVIHAIATTIEVGYEDITGQLE